MEMTKTRAIAIARDRIRICPQGRGYVIHNYRPKVGTRVSHEMPWSAAVAAAKGTKLREALIAMGWSEDDASMAEERMAPGVRWESLVRAPT